MRPLEVARTCTPTPTVLNFSGKNPQLTSTGLHVHTQSSHSVLLVAAFNSKCEGDPCAQSDLHCKQSTSQEFDLQRNVGASLLADVGAHSLRLHERQRRCPDLYVAQHAPPRRQIRQLR
eukprot:1491148-Pleurochrysis_carterae.AAC.1